MALLDPQNILINTRAAIVGIQDIEKKNWKNNYNLGWLISFHAGEYLNGNDITLCRNANSNGKSNAMNYKKIRRHLLWLQRNSEGWKNAHKKTRP